MEDRVTLAIKLRNTASNDPCAVCGVRTDPETGPKLFVDGTWSLVCLECGQKHAPELTAMVLDYRRSRDMGPFLDEH
jgi:hypothetical protein